jgi:hypothetical protein
MRDRQLPLTAIAVALGLGSFFAVSMIAQAPATGGQSAATPSTAKPAPVRAANIRTPWGDPDLHGTWFVTEDVPLERSAANAGREFLTDEEVAAADKQKAQAAGRNQRAGDAAQDVSGAYNAAFNSILKTGKRTSRVIDPPDGRIPPTLAAAAAAKAGGGAQGRGAVAGRGAAGGGRGGFGAQGNDNPENIAQSPRCLGVQLPFLPLNTTFAQGTVMRIIQSPKSISMYLEDDHAGGGNRIIHMDGRQHPPPGIRLYLGDSRGRWEGSTLVVETTNFAQGFRGSNPDTYKMIERFTRTSAQGLRREITFEDPQTWTRPWTVLIEMGKVADERHMIFESACHEGNYGMVGILVGARMEEREAAQKQQAK